MAFGAACSSKGEAASSLLGLDSFWLLLRALELYYELWCMFNMMAAPTQLTGVMEPLSTLMVQWIMVDLRAMSS